MDLCFQGSQALCEFIVRDASGMVTEVQLKPVNLASTETDGVDIEASYRTPVPALFGAGPADLTLRALATHVFKYDTDSGIPNAIITEAAGQNSGNIANWRAYATESYSTDRFSITLAQRWVSPGVIANNWIECTSNCPAPTINNPTVNNNHIKGALYWDLGGTYDLVSSDRGFTQPDLFQDRQPVQPRSAESGHRRLESVPGSRDQFGAVRSVGSHVSVGRPLLLLTIEVRSWFIVLPGLRAVVGAVLLASTMIAAQRTRRLKAGSRMGRSLSSETTTAFRAFTPTIPYSLYYGYGYALAEDRLFQLESTRRSSQGRAAEVFGARYLEKDRDVLTNYDPETLRPQLAALQGEHRLAIDGMVAGINARIRDVLADPDHLLPKQFKDFGFQPERWTDLDIPMSWVGQLLFRFSDYTRRFPTPRCCPS